jgi:hypothetical protein
MRSDVQLIQSAIANFEPLSLIRENVVETRYFNLYSIKLPANFKGFPLNWYFAVLPQQGDEVKPLLGKDEIIAEGTVLINAFKKRGKLPLVVLSDDIRMSAETEFNDGDSAVFFLDKSHLSGKMAVHANIRNAPFILAARNKLENYNLPLYLSPYHPNNPVSGWQFFGRQRELNQVLQSKSNCFILGSRKSGKTSLLLEAEQQLKKAGVPVYPIGVQQLGTFEDVVNALVSKLSTRDAYYAQRDRDILDTKFTANVIRRLRGEERRRIVLVFDELGNVMRRDPKNAWNFLGLLRDLSHTGEIRVLASAFQEVFIRTYKDPDGPLYNFGTMIEINLFSKAEVEELLVNPLSIWYEIEDKGQLISLIRKKFGFHPLILQYLGEYIFYKIFMSGDKRVITHVNKALEQDLHHFKQAYTEIFITNHTILEKYIYLKCCSEARQAYRRCFKSWVLSLASKSVNISCCG